VAVNWIIYAVGAAVALAVADVLVKLAAGKLPSSLGLLLYGCVPFATGLIWFLWDRSRNVSMAVQPQAIMFAVGVGVAFTLVTIALYGAFRAGAPISVASPLIRLAGLLIASVVGVVFWKEGISTRYVLGMVLSVAGLYLIVKPGN
jgi:uncharacterized membrane protein